MSLLPRSSSRLRFQGSQQRHSWQAMPTEPRLFHDFHCGYGSKPWYLGMVPECSWFSWMVICNFPKMWQKFIGFDPFQYGNHLVYQRFWPFWTFISNKWWFPKIGNCIDWKFGGLKFEAGLKQRPFFWGGTSPPTVDHPSNTHRHQTRSSNTCATKIIKICDCVYTDVYIYIYT